MIRPPVSPSPHRRSRTAVVLVLVAVVLGSAAGCRDSSSDPGSDPSSGAASSDTSGSATPPDPSPTEPETEETPLGTGVAPASGMAITLPSLTLKLPRGWEIVSKQGSGFIASPSDPLQVAYLTVSAFDNGGRDTGLDGARREYDFLSDYGDTAKRAGEVEVDGVTMLHLTSPAASKQLVADAFTSNSTGWTVLLEFETELRTKPESQELIDSVLASTTLSQ